MGTSNLKPRRTEAEGKLGPQYLRLVSEVVVVCGTEPLACRFCANSDECQDC